MGNFGESTEQAIAALYGIAELWQGRLDNAWCPPAESAFPWAQVQLSLAALLPGMRTARAWVERARQEKAIQSPRTVAMILAGNTPLLGWSPLCACLLTGAQTIHVKLSRDESVWMPLFVESLRTVAAEIAARITLHDFPGQDDRTTALLQSADAVIAYGSDDAIAALHGKTPTGVPFFGYGHAISIALLCADAQPDAATSFARDILMYDQQGCLSPQMILTEGGSDATFAERLLPKALAQSVDDLATIPVTDPAIAHEIREARDLALFSGYEVLGDDFLRWTIAYSAEPMPIPAPVLHGFIYIQPVGSDTPEALRDLLRPLRGIVSSAGITGTLPEGWEAVLQEAGVSRICSPGGMQTPPLDWTNGNQDLLSVLVASNKRRA